MAAASVITLTVPHPASPVDHEGKVAVSAATLAHECGGRERVLDPACGCRTAIFRAGVEGDGRLRRRTTDGVDHRFKQH